MFRLTIHFREQLPYVSFNALLCAPAVWNIVEMLLDVTRILT